MYISATPRRKRVQRQGGGGQQQQQTTEEPTQSTQARAIIKARCFIALLSVFKGRYTHTERERVDALSNYMEKAGGDVIRRERETTKYNGDGWMENVSHITKYYKTWNVQIYIYIAYISASSIYPYFSLNLEIYISIRYDITCE
jgi:hypothetical protein